MRKETACSSNPSIQCSVCGQWKRMTRKSGPDAGMQTFYPACGEHGEFEHTKPVCDECCKNKCPYRTTNHRLVEEAKITFNRGKKKYVFNVVHNLGDFGMGISAAFDNWSLRTDVWTLQSFCEYVVSKDPINFFCVPKVEWDKNK